MNSASNNTFQEVAPVFGFVITSFHDWITLIVIAIVIFVTIIAASICIYALAKVNNRYESAHLYFIYCEGKTHNIHSWLKRRKQVASLLRIENKIIKRTKILKRILNIQYDPKYPKVGFTTVWSHKYGFIKKIQTRLTSQPFEDMYLIASSTVFEKNETVELNRYEETVMANDDTFKIILREVNTTSNTALNKSKI